MPNSYYFVQCSEHRSYLMYENNNSKCIKWSWRYMALASVDSKSSKEEFFSPVRYGMGHTAAGIIRAQRPGNSWALPTLTWLSSAPLKVKEARPLRSLGLRSYSSEQEAQALLWTKGGKVVFSPLIYRNQLLLQFPQPPYAKISQTLMSQLMSAVSLKTQNRYTIFEHLFQPFQTGRLLVARNMVSPLSSSQT